MVTLRAWLSAPQSGRRGSYSRRHMAQVIPTFEDIAKFRQPATPGELHLLHWLETQLDADTQVFFQPCINGDRPDIVLMHRKWGLLIVDVDFHAEVTH